MEISIVTIACVSVAIMILCLVSLAIYICDDTVTVIESTEIALKDIAITAVMVLLLGYLVMQ